MAPGQRIGPGAGDANIDVVDQYRRAGLYHEACKGLSAQALQAVFHRGLVVAMGTQGIEQLLRGAAKQEVGLRGIAVIVQVAERDVVEQGGMQWAIHTFQHHPYRHGFIGMQTLAAKQPECQQPEQGDGKGTHTLRSCP